ncbi:MAG: hypothetical protein AB1553_03975 [Nitrospirota bacterium]
MNLKESIIHSFLFHFILFLFMLAAAGFTTPLPGGLQDIIPVNLTFENTKDLSDSGTDATDKTPLASSLPSGEEVSLPDQAADNTPEEPEKNVEDTPEPAKIEKAEQPPAQTQRFMSMEDYYRFIILHNKMFRQMAEARVSNLLGEALKVNTRHFYGGTATVSLTFGPDRKVSEVSVDADSPDLKAFLEEIDWGSVPAPAAFSLRFSGVQIEFTVLEGSMSYRVIPM